MTILMFIYIPHIYKTKVWREKPPPFVKYHQKQFYIHVVNIIMELTNHSIFSDLREEKITPSSDTYQLGVTNWLWSQLGERGQWNFSENCHCFDHWVGEKSLGFSKYAKDIWTKSKSSYRNILQRHSEWLEKPIGFPKEECSCVELDENQEVKA